MHRRSAQPQNPHQPHIPPPVQPQAPFDSPTARRLRVALNMGPEHVAYGMRSSYGLPYVTPDLVIAWEHGTVAPTNQELTALAGVLWCAPAELIGTPRTLREHRLARALAPEDLARAIGMELSAYLRMEEADIWRGTDRQAAALAKELELSLPDLITVTGREPKLIELLHNAVTTRWQTHVRPAARLLSLDRRLLEDVLQEMHTEYQNLTTPGPGNSSRTYLDQLIERFWSHIERTERTAY
ncbi:XRE family transcriptional regulator [Streptomyces sp. NPDC002643]